MLYSRRRNRRTDYLYCATTSDRDPRNAYNHRVRSTSSSDYRCCRVAQDLRQVGPQKRLWCRSTDNYRIWSSYRRVLRRTTEVLRRLCSVVTTVRLVGNNDRIGNRSANDCCRSLRRLYYLCSTCLEVLTIRLRGLNYRCRRGCRCNSNVLKRTPECLSRICLEPDTRWLRCND